MVFIPMTCTECRTPLIETNAFCTGCGHPVSGRTYERSPLLLQPGPACPACLRPNAPASHFCTACGTRLPPRSSPQHEESSLNTTDERRTVTLLHADLCGFTRLAEKLDPEETRGLIQSLFAVLSQEILELGGRVEACIGDAILAVFGAPISHGDDARRAVDAALAVHRVLSRFSHPLLTRTGSSLQMRIGVDTGAVVVGRIGTSRQTTITGATVASAMELERNAPPGLSLLGELTVRQLPEEYQLEPHPLPSGKQAFTLRGRLARLVQAPEPGASEVSPGHHRITTLELVPLDQAQAQLDRLAPPERRLLKLAAIAGSRFWAELLERLGIPEPFPLLKNLEVAGLVAPVPHSAVPGTSEYRFLSEAVCEVALQNNLLKVQRFSHRVVAAWLEERLPGDLELLPLLVQHYLAGGDRLAAARALVAGAQRQSARHAHAEALRGYREALRYLDPTLDGTPEGTLAEGGEGHALRTRALDALAQLPGGPHELL